MTLAWLIAGIVFYVPANLLPVMHTSGLLGEADSGDCIGGIGSKGHASYSMPRLV